MNDKEVFDFLKNVFQGVEIGSDIAYQRDCQQIMNSHLNPLQKEQIINELTFRYQQNKNVAQGVQSVTKLVEFITNITSHKGGHNDK